MPENRTPSRNPQGADSASPSELVFGRPFGSSRRKVLNLSPLDILSLIQVRAVLTHEEQDAMEVRILDPDASPAGAFLDWTTPLAVEAGTLEIRFEDRPHPFLVREYSCDSPDCPCREMTLEFTEADQDRGKAKDRLSFQVRFDVERGQVVTGPRVPAEAALLVEEFSSGLDANLVSWLRRRFDASREVVLRGARFEMPAEEILRGTLVAWTDVFTEEGSITSGGTCCTSGFVDGEVEWFVEDLYCMNPSCDCRTVHLLFQWLSPDVRMARHAFTAVVRINGKLESFELGESDRAEANRTYERWRLEDPDLPELFARRYEELRTIGLRILDRAHPNRSQDMDMTIASSSKVGRNAPCPCGSGKKYKRCCGG